MSTLPSANFYKFDSPPIDLISLSNFLLRRATPSVASLYLMTRPTCQMALPIATIFLYNHSMWALSLSIYSSYMSICSVFPIASSVAPLLPPLHSLCLTNSLVAVLLAFAKTSLHLTNPSVPPHLSSHESQHRTCLSVTSVCQSICHFNLFLSSLSLRFLFNHSSICTSPSIAYIFTPFVASLHPLCNLFCILISSVVSLSRFTASCYCVSFI